MKRIILLLLVLLATGGTASWGQARTVTGKVLDDKGLGIPSAGITVKGTTVGTVTDFDGNFSINVPDGATTLVIQGLGYQQAEVAANNGMTVRLQSASRELTGAVVTALAIRREKRELGYSAATISSEDLDRGNNVSALSAIAGKTAGVNITSSTGGPGGSTRIVLRGEKSITGGNNALMVVDGVIINNVSRLNGRDSRSQIDYGNRGNDVNPEDIESITVLKGPVAAALYGAVGANGAIIITTKSGKARSNTNKKSNLTYQTSYTLSNVLKLPDFQNTYGQGDVNANPTDPRENFSWGLPFDGQVRPWGQRIDGEQRVKPYSALPDNVRHFFQTGQSLENNVSLGGSNDKGSYYLALNTLNSKGVIPSTFYNKYGVRLNTTYNITDKIYTGFNVNYLNIYSKVETSGQDNESVLNNVYQQPRDIPITELKNLSDPFNAYGTVDALGVAHYGYYGAYTDNPYFVLQNVDNRNRTDHVLGNVVLGIKPNTHWDIFDRFGVDFISDRATQSIGKYTYVPYDPYYVSAGGTQNRVNPGGYSQSSNTDLLINNDLMFNYNTQISEDIGFNGLVGFNSQIARTTQLGGIIDNQTNGLVLPNYYNLNNNQGPVDITDFYSNERRYGIYSELRADFRKQVFFDVTARNDWSSTLSSGNNSFFYPSASLSWVFSETLKKQLEGGILSFGKIRGGFSSVGAATTPYNNNNSGFITASSSTGFGTVKFPFDGTTGFSYQNRIGNQALRPERTTAYEAGLELAFFKNRLTFQGTIYNQISSDQIVSVPVDPATGFTSRVVNLGDVSNKGVELEARVTPVSTASGFRWEVFGTYTKNKNIVERLPGGVNQISIDGISGLTVTATVGKPFGAFYGTDLARDPQGRVIVDSATGTPKIAANTTYLGSYQPKFIASWGTSLKFRGFQLNVLFQTKQGGVFYSRTKDIMDFTGTAEETGDRSSRPFPNSVYQNSQGQYVQNTNIDYDVYNYYTNVIPSGQHVVDASYVKLQEASLSYSLPEKLLKRSMFGSCSIGIFGNNLFIWTAKSNKYSDPEMNSVGATNAQGFDFTSRPSVRNYGINLRVSF